MGSPSWCGTTHQWACLGCPGSSQMGPRHTLSQLQAARVRRKGTLYRPLRKLIIGGQCIRGAAGWHDRRAHVHPRLDLLLFGWCSFTSLPADPSPPPPPPHSHPTPPHPTPPHPTPPHPPSPPTPLRCSRHREAALQRHPALLLPSGRGWAPTAVTFGSRQQRGRSTDARWAGGEQGVACYTAVQRCPTVRPTGLQSAMPANPSSKQR